jgi:hypothetical protein
VLYDFLLQRNNIYFPLCLAEFVDLLLTDTECHDQQLYQSKCKQIAPPMVGSMLSEHIQLGVSMRGGSQQGQQSELCTGMQSTQPLVMVEPLNLLHLLTLPKTLTNADTTHAV